MVLQADLVLQAEKGQKAFAKIFVLTQKENIFYIFGDILFKGKQ